MPRFVWFALVTIFALAAGSPAKAQDRVALVIGNAAYKSAFALKNPINDADAIGAALARMGFAVTTLKDASAADTRRELAAFASKAKKAEAAAFFFAGQSIEVDGVSWLVPVDGNTDTLADVMKSSLSLEKVLETLLGVRKAGLVLIDAGRSNPFAKPGERVPGGRVSGGLKQSKEPEKILIGFSTSVGSMTLDGDGSNSPFTAALLRHIETPGVSLSQLMRRVQADVATATGGKQRPAYYDTLVDDSFALMPR